MELMRIEPGAMGQGAEKASFANQAPLLTNGSLDRKAVVRQVISGFVDYRIAQSKVQEIPHRAKEALDIEGVLPQIKPPCDPKVTVHNIISSCRYMENLELASEFGHEIAKLDETTKNSLLLQLAIFSLQSKDQTKITKRAKEMLDQIDEKNWEGFSKLLPSSDAFANYMEMMFAKPEVVDGFAKRYL
jgi:hypothetical protein